MSEKVQSGGGSGGGFDLKKFIAEAVGTACLTFVACGTATVKDGNFALSFGLTLVAMVTLIGNISGCHINPAVSLSMLIRKKMSLCEFGVYVGAQFLGGLVGSFLLGLCKRGKWKVLGDTQMQPCIMKREDIHGNDITSITSCDGDKKDAWAYIDAILIELILTFIFVLVVNAATEKKCYEGKHANIIIGLTLALVHYFGGSFTGPSVNPARSFGPALIECFNGDAHSEAIKQIWIYIVGPLAGGALAGLAFEPLTG